MKIKLLVSDIDNTILRSDGSLSEETTRAFNEAASAGISTVLASSRLADTIGAVQYGVGDFRYMIMLAGCRIADMRSGECLFSCHMDRPIALEIVDYLETQHDCYFEVVSGNEFLISGNSLSYIYHIGAFRKYMKDLQPCIHQVDSIGAFIREHPNRHIEKLFFYSRDKENFQKIRDYLPRKNEICLLSPVKQGLDVLPPAVNKGESLRFLLSYLGISEEQVMVFGDSDNDADMFLPHTYNVAVGNAYESLKQKATFVTRTNDEDGVAYAIRSIALR